MPLQGAETSRKVGSGRQVGQSREVVTKL